MPKTPPLLLPAGPAFQYDEDTPSYQSFLAPLPPSSYIPASRPPTLDTVMEEETQISMAEDMLDIDNEESTATSRTRANDTFSQHDQPRPTTQSSPITTQTSDHQQSTNDTTTKHGAEKNFPHESPTQPLQEEGAWPSPDNDNAGGISASLNISYESIITKYQDLKEMIDCFASTLAESEVDQKDAIHDLQNYKETLQIRGERLHERWIQAQAHAQGLLQLPPLSDDPSSQ